MISDVGAAQTAYSVCVLRVVADLQKIVAGAAGWRGRARSRSEPSEIIRNCRCRSNIHDGTPNGTLCARTMVASWRRLVIGGIVQMCRIYTRGGPPPL